MARDGNGTYSAPVNTWNPAINGVLATAGDWQQLLNDIVAALTQSVSRDGQTPMTGNLALGNNKITGLTPGSGTGEALAFQQLFNQGTMADIASAATTDIGVQNTNFLRVTGNTTITSFGTNYRGPRFLVFEQNITLTNSSTLVLPGAQNLSMVAGDSLIAIPGATLGTPDKWIVVATSGAKTLLAGTSDSLVTTNAYFSSGWKYLTSGIPSSYYYQNSGSHRWYTAPSGTAGNAISFTQAMTLASNGNLLIGNTADSGSRLQVGGSSGPTTNPTAIEIDNTYSSSAAFNRLKLYLFKGASETYGFSVGELGDIQYWAGSSYTGAHRWFTSQTERARIDSSGDFMVGKTSASDTSVGGHITSAGRVVSTMAGSDSFESTLHVYSTGAGAYRFFVNLAGVVNATNTTISAISDQRLKENIQDIDVGLDKIMALKPRKYDWKAGKGKDIKGDRGWIAQEFEQVFPDMVDQWLDPAPEGEEPYKSVRADLIPVLVKAIQEQQALIQTLTARVAALESN